MEKLHMLDHKVTFKNEALVENYFLKKHIKIEHNIALIKTIKYVTVKGDLFKLEHVGTFSWMNRRSGSWC